MSLLVQQYKGDGFFILCGKRAYCRKKKHLVAQLSGRRWEPAPVFIKMKIDAMVNLLVRPYHCFLSISSLILPLTKLIH